MKRIALWLFVVAMVAGVVAARAETSTPAREPPSKLIVDSPLPDLLARGVVWITPSTLLHGLDICTYTWRTCLGCGRI
jgi:hypothetical protein